VIDDFNQITVESGFLIVKTFERLYRESAPRYELTHDIYALPRIDRTPDQYVIQYQGLDRDALGSLPSLKAEWTSSRLLAETRMTELEDLGLSIDDFLFTEKDTKEVFDWLVQEESGYEIIWTRIAENQQIAPSGFVSIGFEPSYFTGDHFAASCDCMLFPRWHGTDPEGQLFIPYFRQLNHYGLFDTVSAARSFLEYYLSFDWTEPGDYFVAEVFIRP
jgi:hypothetical protein